ncbi:chalcone isomerase family protein [Achromobacter sp. Marseille-Q0513]|uniref:chalcone isomerase family protein n=1 Tax=Achromobacter sp. Marseille-Q0513 TaxID=2829161 RepID=UPI001BA24EA3|nr:chalcone isomerase family protein [Achromobacter sp. Marseille-Q0513]MBR8652846.1 chalcone isomerase family protein [Achromobacter sp. Marseille-Q0513]
MHRIPGGRIAALSLILAAALAGAPALAADVEVGGLRVPDQLSEGGRALVLNGAGVRTKFVVKVYVAALYATAKTSDAAALVNSAEPRRMRLHMLRDVDSKSLDGALQDGLRDNTPKQELEALKEPAQRLSALMASVGSAKEGDVIDLDFDAKGVSVSDNGKARGRIDDPAFARALLRVWLGENPSQSSLKKALLGN